MLVSIVIPVYNSEETLATCLDSLLSQTYEALELIVVNDGSTDTSGDILAAYQAKDPRLNVLSCTNGGQGQARNLGMSMAKGDYLAFVDADDDLPVEGIQNLVKALDHGPFDIVAGAYMRYEGHIKHLVCACDQGLVDKHGNHSEIKRYKTYKTSSTFGYVWGKLYAKAFLDRFAIQFSTSKKVLLEDSLFNIKVMTHSPAYFFIDQLVYNYRVQASSTSHKKQVYHQEGIDLVNAAVAYASDQKALDMCLDLVLPLALRTHVWVSLKLIESGEKSIKTIWTCLLAGFKSPQTQRVIHSKGAFKSLKGIHPLSHRAFYMMTWFLCKGHLYGLMAAGLVFGHEMMTALILHHVKRGK